MSGNLEPQPSQSPAARRKRGRPRKTQPDGHPAQPDAFPGQPRSRKPERVKRAHHVHSMPRSPGGQLLKKGATPEEIADVMRRGDAGRRKKRAATLFKRFRVDVVLKDEHREEYERMAESPEFTGRELHAWLLGRGYDVCLRAVLKHRKSFYNQVNSVRMTARTASAFAAVVKRHGRGAMAEATALRYEQLLMERLFNLKPDESAAPPSLPAEEWVQWGKAAGQVVSSHTQMERLRAELSRESRDREAATNAARKDAARKGEAKSQSAADQARLDAEERRKSETPEERKAREMKVVDRVAEMLGLPVWQGDEDWRYGVPKYRCETFIGLDGVRRDINGRTVADSEVDEAGYLKVPPKPDYVPPGIEPLNPPVPHPRATKQYAAVEPVERPLAQAIYEAKHAAAQQAAAEGKPYTPPKNAYWSPSPPVQPPHGPALQGEAFERLQEKTTREEQARREADKKAAEKWEEARRANEEGGRQKPEAGSEKPEGGEPPPKTPGDIAGY